MSEHRELIELARKAYNAGVVAGKSDSLIMVEFAAEQVKAATKPLVAALVDARNEVLTCVSLNRKERKRMSGRITAALEAARKAGIE